MVLSPSHQALLPAESWEGLRREITKDFDGLRDLLRAVVVMKTNDERTREIVSGHGEVGCAMAAELLSMHVLCCTPALEMLTHG